MVELGGRTQRALFIHTGVDINTVTLTAVQHSRELGPVRGQRWGSPAASDRSRIGVGWGPSTAARAGDQRPVVQGMGRIVIIVIAHLMMIDDGLAHWGPILPLTLLHYLYNILKNGYALE